MTRKTFSVIIEPMPEENAPAPHVVSRPKFSLLRVLFAVIIGLILVGTGFAFAFRGQLANLFNSSPTTTTTNIKPGTSSSKTATSSPTKDETADWLTYNSKSFKVRYPKDWSIGKDKSDLENVLLTKDGRTIDFKIVSAGGVSPGKQGTSSLKTIEVLFNGQTIKANEIIYSDKSWELFPQSLGSNKEFFDLYSPNKPDDDTRSLILKIVSTFKFL